MFCIFVAIGMKQLSIAEIQRACVLYNTMNYTIIVSASAADSVAMRFIAPYAGCAIGE